MAEKITVSIASWAADNDLTIDAALDLAKRQGVYITKLKGIRFVNKNDMDSAFVLEIKNQKDKQDKRLASRRKLAKTNREANVLYKGLKALGVTSINEALEDTIDGKKPSGASDEILVEQARLYIEKAGDTESFIALRNQKLKEVFGNEVSTVISRNEAALSLQAKKAEEAKKSEKAEESKKERKSKGGMTKGDAGSESPAIDVQGGPAEGPTT